MISAEGIFHRSKKTECLVHFEASERPVGIQVFGANADHIAYAAAYIEEHFRPDFIDLNSGCPVQKVVKKNGGAALLCNLPLLKKIVAKMVKAVSVPVTVKLRSGWSVHDLVDVECAKICEDCGASAIILHPRTKSMGFSGHAMWDRIAEVKKNVRIPVIGNGDICTPADASEMLRQTGCDSIMIGRAALGNPWIFDHVKSYCARGEYTPVTNAQRLSTVLEQIMDFCAVHGEKRALAELKKHIGWYIKGQPQAANLRNRIFRAETVRLLEEVAKEAFR
ncbi:MAG: tRNA dihydrouridine synthase DusB, partial [Chitinivibrionales bacterium]